MHANFSLSVVFPQSLCWLLLTSGIRTALKDDAMQAGWAVRGAACWGGMLWCWGMKAGDCSSLLDSAVRCRKLKNTGKVIRSVYMKMGVFSIPVILGNSRGLLFKFLESEMKLGLGETE